MFPSVLLFRLNLRSTPDVLPPHVFSSSQSLGCCFPLFASSLWSRNIEFATKKKTIIRLGDFACLRLPPAGSIVRVPGPPNRKEARGKEMKGWERNRTVGPNPEKGKQRRQPAYYNFYFNFNFILLLFFVCTTWSGLPGQAIPVGSLSFCRDAGKTRLAWLCPFFCLYNSQTTMRIVLSLVS